MAAKFDLLVYACDKNSSWLMAHRSRQVTKTCTKRKTFDLQGTKSRETWCYAGTHPVLKEKRPGFVFADGKNKLIADGSWQVTKTRTKRKTFDLQGTKSRETWCYAGTHPDLKEKRPGFLFADGKNGSWLMAHRSWQVPKPRTMWIYFDLQATKSRETWCYAGTHPDLKEKRPGFVFADGKNGSWLMAHRSWQVL